MPGRSWRPVVVATVCLAVVALPLGLWAADSFSDVSSSNVHRNDIAWLQDNDVTLGCNPPTNTQFCPGQPVLRQQMASFMRRLAEGKIVDAATAVDADRVGGRRPSELGRIAYVTADADDDRLIGGSHLATTITAPTKGFLAISYTGEVIATDRSPDTWGCMIGVDGGFPDAGAGYGSSSTQFFIDGCTAQLVMEVAAGEHRVEVVVERTFDTAEFRAGSLTAQFVPFDGSGRLATLDQSADGDRSLEEQLDRFRTTVSEMAAQD